MTGTLAHAVFATSLTLSMDAAADVPHVRALDPQTATVLADGMARSAEFRRLVDRIESLDGIVFIRAGVDPRRSRDRLGGFLSQQVTCVRGFRLLHIVVAPQSRGRAPAVLAHELQHAVELLEEPRACIDADVEALFARIGFQVRAGVVETEAAVRIEKIVARQIAMDRRIAR